MPSDSPTFVLPLVVGVTGHRDLRPADAEPLTNSVLAILQGLCRKFPHTPVVLMSALAEGADRLAAEAALTAGARLFVPLPLPAHLYEQDFKTAESLAAFRGLLGRTERVFVVPYVGDNDDANVADPARRVLQYAAAGAVIAHQSQVLLALWDGEDSPKGGGTAAIVRFWCGGVPPLYGPARGLLAAVNAGPLCHVVTPRQSNPDPSQPFTWDRDYLRGHDAVPRHIDAFNRDAGRLGPRLERKQAAVREEVLPAAALAALPADVGAAAAVLRDGYGLADALALHFQARARRTRFVLFVLAFLAAVLVRTALGLPGERWIHAAYAVTAGALGAACVLAWFARYHARRLSYRALAEGLRVQLFWRLAGVAALAPDGYLRVQRRALEWVRVALRNAALLAGQGGDADAAGPAGLALATVYWVRAQQAYFERSAQRDLKKHRRLHVGRYVALAVGLLWLATETAARLTGRFPEPADWAAAALRLGPASARILQNLDVLIVAGLLIGGAMLIAYGKARGFDKHARRYQDMFDTFSDARALLERQPPPSDEEARELLRKVGTEALCETGEWVVIEEREVEPRPA